jgi:hypothetical protein
MMRMPAETPPKLALRDIHLPPDPSWWPPAPGWWLLALALLAFLAFGAWLGARRRRLRRECRRVLGEVAALEARCGDDDALLAQGLHQLLRRVARRFDPAAAHQRGEPWRRTLARVPVKAATLDALDGLERRMYQPQAAFDRTAALAATREWLAAAWRRVPRARRERDHA